MSARSLSTKGICGLAHGRRILLDRLLYCLVNRKICQVSIKCIDCSILVTLGLLEPSPLLFHLASLFKNCDCAISSLTLDFKTNYNMSMTMTKYLPVVLAPYHVGGRLPITSPRSAIASSSRLGTFDPHYFRMGS